MDVTQFIVSQREEGLSTGDYGFYKRHLGRRILTLRKRLRFTFPYDQKGSVRRLIASEDIRKDDGFIKLLLLSSERAWAHALYIKATQSMDSSNAAIPNSSKRQIVSRLHRATLTSAHLFRILEAQGTQATTTQVRQAWAYHASLLGATAFEKARWKACAEAYSIAYRLYRSASSDRDMVKKSSGHDILENYVEPSLRYAAYQLKISRTTSMETLVERHIPRESELVKRIFERDAGALALAAEYGNGALEVDQGMVPKTIEWRSRVVPLEDASTAQALAVVANTEKRLSDTLSVKSNLLPQERAAAYDDTIIAVQDAVDAVKTALNELSREGIAQSDHRFQSLQVTWTAVAYSLVKWTVSRNRILCGDEDGARLDRGPSNQSLQQRGNAGATAQAQSKNKFLARLRERLVLYDASIQSLESAKSLPGVPADTQFVAEIQSVQSYFQTLRCLTIARSHSLVGSKRQSLALLLRAQRILVDIEREAKLPQAKIDSARNRIDVTPEQLAIVREILQCLILEHRGVVELSAGVTDSAVRASNRLCDLGNFSAQSMDLSRLVSYPPKITPVPVKPIFLDIAYNFIDYIQDFDSATRGDAAGFPPSQDDEKAASTSGRKGWFGFGR